MKASTQQSGLQGSGRAALENEKVTTLTAITLRSKYISYVRSPAPSHTQTLNNPFEPLQIKWEVNIFIKKSSCVFIIASVYLLYRNDAVDEHITEIKTLKIMFNSRQ